MSEARRNTEPGASMSAETFRRDIENIFNSTSLFANNAGE